MPAFTYTAKMEDGRTVKGAIEAPSRSAALERLHRQGLIVLQVVSKKAASKPLFTKKVKLDDLAVFARQMATLVDAGIPIVSGLEAVADQLENPTLREVVTKVYEAVEGGMNLTTAIAKQSSTFSPLFISMVRAGEASGHLAEVLSRLATYLEKSAALQRKVRTACIYPAIVISMAVLITTFLMIKVIPVFKDMFNQLDIELPLSTKILMATSDAIQWLVLPGIVLCFVGPVFFKQVIMKNPKSRLWCHRTLLNMAVVGPIARKIAIAKFARTLSTLIKSGVPILSGLEIVAETSGNRVLELAVLQVRASIKEGENIAAPLAAGKVFPPLVVRMIAIGEQTGRLDDMLTKVAEFYEEQSETAIAGLTSAIEPVIIAVLGVVIGGIVISIFLPIFKLTQALS
ncbi:MAG: type II secretion system F family protein [Candidatus Omnitrophica bacterium]|nr:type II secretion system F family protein [Candidatus Omnitrophota bacterium]